MINALLDVLHENTSRLRYLSTKVDDLSAAFGGGYIDDVNTGYTGNNVDDIIFAAEEEVVV